MTTDGGAEYHVYRRGRSGRGFRIFSDIDLAALPKRVGNRFRLVAVGFGSRAEAELYVNRMTADDPEPPGRAMGSGSERADHLATRSRSAAVNASMLDLVDALREVGLTIPEGVDSVEGLILAVRANRKRGNDRGGSGGMGDEMKDQPGGPGRGPPAKGDAPVSS